MLTVLEVLPSSKVRRPMLRCRCDCGKERLVRADRLQRGEISTCSTCAKSAGAKRSAASRRLPTAVATSRNIRGWYRYGALRRGLSFDLSDLEVFRLLYAECHYCGAAANPTNGIDRTDNSEGYTTGNVVTACSICNYAKRDMTYAGFKAWVEKIYAHQSLLQRDRPLLLRLDQQPDGRRPYHSGEN